MAKEVAREAAADHGANLEPGFGVDAGYADEAGLHAGEIVITKYITNVKDIKAN